MSPPVEYKVDHKDDVEIFRMLEHLSWNIVTHFMKKWKNYYKWNFDISKYNNITTLIDKI